MTIPQNYADETREEERRFDAGRPFPSKASIAVAALAIHGDATKARFFVARLAATDVAVLADADATFDSGNVRTGEIQVLAPGEPQL